MHLKRTFAAVTTAVALSLSSTAVASAEGSSQAVEDEIAYAITDGVSSGSSADEQVAGLIAITGVLGLGVIGAVTAGLSHVFPDWKGLMNMQIRTPQVIDLR